MYRYVFLSLIFVCCCFGVDDQSHSLDIMTSSSVALPSILQGSICGAVGKVLIFAGGIEADGDITDSIRVISLADGQIAAVSKLDKPVAFGTAVIYQDSIIFAGGIDNNGVSSAVCEIRYSGGVITEKMLPSIPVALLDCGAGILDDVLYIVNGSKSADGSQFSNQMYSLDLKNLQSGWLPMTPFPGTPVMPAVVATLDEQLLVFGGSSSGEVWGYRQKPLDGTTVTGWQKLSGIPEGFVPMASVKTGQNHIMLVGEDCINDQLNYTIYNNITDNYVSGVVECAQFRPINAVGLTDSILAQMTDGSQSKLLKIEFPPAVKMLATADYAVMIAYFGIMALIGVYFAGKQNSSDEFSLGSRNVRWWAAAISMFATGASSISFMAIPAQTYRTNMIWLTPVFFLIPLYFVQAYLIFPLLRKLQLTSTYQYLEMRFSKVLRYIASAQCIAFQLLGRMTVVMLLPSLAISTVTGLDVSISVLIMGLLTTAYTAFGGFEAVIWTDVTQGILMLVGMLLMILFAIGSLSGGMSEFWEIGNEYDKFKVAIIDLDLTLPSIWIFAFMLIMQQLAMASDQPTIQRVLATPLKNVRKLAGLSIFFGVVIAILANMAGIAIFAYFHSRPDMMNPTMSNDQVVPLYVIRRLPVGVSGLIIAALFAASMSTLSSSMNSVATIACEDFYRKLFPQSTDKGRLAFMKISSLFVGLIGTGFALYMAKMNIRSMFQTWNELCALLGGGFIGIYILGMFSRRANTAGVVIGAFASILCTVLIKKYTNIHWAYYMPTAVLSCVIVGYITSLLIPIPQKDLAGLTVFDTIKDGQ